ncbi:MAG TPA: VanZ family protein [Bacilli bacterium]|nr:VanZ family protein [Bacilli bacterium]
MIKSRLRFGIFLLLSLFWMGLIFYKSGEPYQQQDLRPWLRTLIDEDTLLAWLPPIEFTYDGGLVSYKHPYSMLEYFIRKCGHVTEYAALTFLLWQTFAATTIRKKVALPVCGLLAIGYAASDEFHQTFVAGRTGHAIDVYTFDSLGVLLVLLIAWAVEAWLSRRADRKLT